MTSKLVRPIILAFGFCIAAQPTAGHHSFSTQYDASQLLVYRGVMTKLEWTNPHVMFHVNVKDEKSGAVKPWTFEAATTNTLRRYDSQMRDYFLANVGKPMSVTASPARNGSPSAAAAHVKFADGLIAPLTGEHYTGPLDSEQLLRDLD